MTDLVEPVFDLKSKIKQNDVVNKIKELLKEIPQDQINELRTTPSFILYVCNLVENTITKKHCKDKKALVIDILQSVVSNLTDQEKKQISDVIQFLWNNKDIVKYKVLSRLGIYALKYLKKVKF